jgi:hypothetical protein
MRPVGDSIRSLVCTLVMDKTHEDDERSTSGLDKTWAKR